MRGIICLNRMIDTDEKMKELREMDTKFKDLEVQKRDADLKWTEYVDEYNRNNEELGNIKQKERNIIKQEYKRKWPETLFLKVGTSAINRNNSGRKFWRTLQTVITSDLSFIDKAQKKTTEETRSLLDSKIKLIAESNLAIHSEHKKIEQWISDIETKYEEVKQKNGTFFDPDSTGDTIKYLNTIKEHIQEIESCIENIKQIFAAWEKEEHLLEDLTKALTATIKDQTELIFAIEKQIRSLSFLLNSEEGMAQHNRMVQVHENLMADTEIRWNRYMTSLGHKFECFDRIPNKDKKEILHSLHEYMQKSEVYIQQNNFSQQRCGQDETNRENRKEEDTEASISHLTETADHLHQEMKNTIAQSQKEMILLHGNIQTQYRKVQTPNCTHSFERQSQLQDKLVEITSLLESIEKMEEIVQLGSQSIQKWHDGMNVLETKAKELESNPFNIQIDHFNQLKEECLTTMSQQGDKVSYYKLRFSNHAKERNEHVEMLDKINRWIYSMPYDAVQRFKEVQDSALDKVNLSKNKASDISEKIDCGEKEIDVLEDKINDLRSKMTGIESITENPRLFAIESMTPENITHVFSELDKWHEMYGSLKEAVDQWNEKTKELEDNIIKWEAIVDKKYKG